MIEKHNDMDMNMNKSTWQ